MVNVEVIFKLTNKSDGSTYSVKFENSTVEINGNYLLIKKTHNDSILTKLYDLKEVHAYTEYNNK
jgi:hypothetical protein